MEENEHTGGTLHGSHWGTLEECMGEYVPITRSSFPTYISTDLHIVKYMCKEI